MLLNRTLKDMNKSKLVAEDLPLFESLLKDIFPSVGPIEPTEYKEVQASVNALIKEKNLQSVPDWVIKVIQLYETSLVRHGFMLVGSAGSGKTTIANTLTQSLTNIGLPHKMIRMNPKSISGQQMYGVMNPATQEWTQGVFSAIWGEANKKSNTTFTWLVCDGPVDAIWIENLNTVLDDNKILTLANNDRIAMLDNVKMTFEVENLNNASPATVSRNGIVYVSETDLYWKPLIDTWVADRISDKESFAGEPEWMKKFTEKYFLVDTGMHDVLKKTFISVMYVPDVCRVSMLLNLFTSILVQVQEKGVALNET